MATNMNYPNTQQQGEKALDKYAQNLCELARKGKLDPVIGRDEEIRRVLQILSRRTKNNPVLVQARPPLRRAWHSVLCAVTCPRT